MTPAMIGIARHLGRCTFLPGSWDKRFARDIAALAEHSPDKDLTDRQAAHLLRLTHKYRRQMPTQIVMDALDEMEKAAETRVANGLGALPDFTPARVSKRKARAEAKAAETPAPQPTLFDRDLHHGR